MVRSSSLILRAGCMGARAAVIRGWRYTDVKHEDLEKRQHYIVERVAERTDVGARLKES